jgi:hypothetical protein
MTQKANSRSIFNVALASHFPIVLVVVVLCPRSGIGDRGGLSDGRGEWRKQLARASVLAHPEKQPRTRTIGFGGPHPDGGMD